MADSLNPFETAPQIVNDLKNHVTTKQNEAITNARQTVTEAKNAVRDMARAAAGLKMGNITAPAAPNVPHLNISGLQLPQLPQLPAGSFGHVSGIAAQGFQPTGINPVAAPHINDFNPSFSHIQLPDAPQHGPVPLPAAPVLNKPALPDLVDLHIPAFSYAPLAPYDDDNPAFVASSISAVLQWQEAAYQPVLMDEEIAVLRRMWAGGTGLPPAVEQALWERAAGREDMDAQRDIDAAMVEFSSRGFSLPPGALLARIDGVRHARALQKQTLGRDILIKISDTHIENLRFACTQAIAAENVLIGVWGQMAQRAFEAAKIHTDMQLAVLNARIATYNAVQGARQTSANIRRMELEEKAHELQVWRAQLEGEIARGQINEQRLKVFTAQWQALGTEVEVYKSRMQGAAIEADVQKKDVDRYRAQIEAAAEMVKIDKLRFDAYDSRIRGEVGKARIIQAQAQGYSAYVQGKGIVADIAIKNQGAQLQREELRLKAFIANLDVQKAQLQAQVENVAANARMHESNTARYSAQANAQASFAQVQLAAWQASAQVSVSQWEAQMRKVVADMEQMMRTAALQMQGLQAVAQAYATLAAGQTAGISIGASVGASGSVSASGSSTVSQSI